MGAPADEYAVTATVRYAARQRGGEWYVVRQVWKSEGGWWSQLHRQHAARDAGHARGMASTLAQREMEYLEGRKR